jgi:branched-chain amino acid transport system ATP-binding protein
MTHPLLEVHEIELIYDRAILAVRDVSLEVRTGEIVALLGANGAGKSSTLKALAGLLGAERAEQTRGAITFDGVSTAGTPAADLVARGLVLVLEGRHCFPHLTIEENLITGAIARRTRGKDLRADIERMYTYFPSLREKRTLPAALASGGQQQMTAIGRALMAHPRLLLLDEPSMGLAPLISGEIFAVLGRLAAENGLSILVAEQSSALALRHAARAYVLETGRVVLSGTTAELRGRDDIQQFYLGAATAGRGPQRARAVRSSREATGLYADG